MSFSLPGTDLYYLARDNLSPEEYERIMPPEKAWHMIRRDFFFSDTPSNNVSVSYRPSVRFPPAP